MRPRSGFRSTVTRPIPAPAASRRAQCSRFGWLSVFSPAGDGESSAVRTTGPQDISADDWDNGPSPHMSCGDDRRHRKEDANRKSQSEETARERGGGARGPGNKRLEAALIPLVVSQVKNPVDTKAEIRIYSYFALPHSCLHIAVGSACPRCVHGLGRRSPVVRSSVRRDCQQIRHPVR
jgi:hypothetical protein